MSGYSPSLLKWHNVSMVRSTGDGVIFRCGNCGHKWRSYSKNAMRIKRSLPNNACNRPAFGSGEAGESDESAGG